MAQCPPPPKYAPDRTISEFDIIELIEPSLDSEHEKLDMRQSVFLSKTAAAFSIVT